MMVPLVMLHAHHPATKLVTALPPGTDEMPHSAPGGDGAVLTGLLVRNPTREWEMIGRPPLNAVPEQ